MEARRQRLIQRRGWDTAVAHYERYWARQLAPAQDLLLSRAGLVAGEDVLDVACGTGLVTLAAAAAVADGPRGRVTATDLSPAMVSEVETRARRAGLTNIDGLVCGAEELTPEGPYDVALCSLGLMYVPAPVDALGEMRRVLRPGGRVVVSVWGERRRCGWAELFGIVDARVSSDVCPMFFALGAPGSLRAVMERAGFVDVDHERLSVDLEYANGSEAVGAAFLGGPVALAYAHFDARTKAGAEREYLASIAGRRTGSGGYRVPGEFVVAWGRRP
jgi:ubiquinone/menaquinone biosynthesis C-methylase UbiE